MTHERPLHWILVVGAASGDGTLESTARAVGALLPTIGLGLIVGNWKGCDEWVAGGAADTVRRHGRAPKDWIIQVANAPWLNNNKLPLEGCRRWTSPFTSPYDERGVDEADAGIILGGLKGSGPSMDALDRRGKPVLPLAWLGGDAFDLFRTTLGRASAGEPVPGVSMDQYLQLVRPWTRGVPTWFGWLLRSVLTTQPQVFVSYRRDDVPVIADRLTGALARSLGPRVVYQDAQLGPGAPLDHLIQRVRTAAVVIAVIGRKWMPDVPREPDWVVRELSAAREAGVAVVPVPVDGAELAGRPEALAWLDGLNQVPLTRRRFALDVEELASDVAGRLGWS